MDYDDKDFQSQNLHLAGEGSTGFPPVLRTYALPKFDFDDNLQGPVRFDSLVETEVFLGIESNDDNQWIGDFSRGNSGIEFNSTAAESCSILRLRNVWSEATSSESVEMLLNSVGQEDSTPAQSLTEEFNAFDNLDCLTKQMEPSLKHDGNSFPENFSCVKEHAGELPQSEDVSQIVKEDAVEILLKSVGQEDSTPAQSIIRESNAFDNLDCSTKQVEPSFKHDDNRFPENISIVKDDTEEFARREDVSQIVKEDAVEMLLKSVGQEDSKPAQSIIEKSDAFDNLDCLTKQIEPLFKHDDNSFPENFSVVKEDAGELPRSKDDSQTEDGKTCFDGSLSKVDSDFVSKNGGSPVVEENPVTDAKSKLLVKSKVNTSVNESMDDKNCDKDREGSSDSENYRDVMLRENVTPGNSELSNEKVQSQISDRISDNPVVLETDNFNSEETESAHGVGKETQTDDRNVLLSTSMDEAKEARKEVDVYTTDVKEYSSVTLKCDNVLGAVGYSELVRSDIPDETARFHEEVSCKLEEFGDQSKVSTDEASYVVIKGDRRFEACTIDVSSTVSGVSANKEPKMDSVVRSMCTKTNVLEEKNELQFGNEMLVSKPGSPLPSDEANKVQKGGESSNSHAGHIHSLSVVSSSNELTEEINATGIQDNSPCGVPTENLDADEHHQSFTLVESPQTCEENTIHGKDNVPEQDVSVNEKESTGLTSNSVSMEYEVAGSLLENKGDDPPSFVECRTEDELIVRKSTCDATAGEPVSVVSLDKSSVAACGPSDSGNLPSGDIFIEHEDTYRKEDHLPPFEPGCSRLDKKEENAVTVSCQLVSSQLETQVSSQLEAGSHPLSEAGNYVPSVTTEQMLYESVDNSLPRGKKCDIESPRGSQVAVNIEIIKNRTQEMDTCPLPCDSTAKVCVNTETVSGTESNKKDHLPYTLSLPSSIKDPENNIALASGDKISTQAVAMNPSRDVGRSESSFPSPSLRSHAHSRHVKSRGFASVDKPTSGSSDTVGTFSHFGNQKEDVKVFTSQIIQVSEAIDGGARPVQSSQDLKGNGAPKDERSLALESTSSVDLIKRNVATNMQSFPVISAGKVSLIVDGSLSTSVLDKIESRNTNYGSPKASDGENVRSNSKGTVGRKTRRASAKGVVKDSAKKGNPMVETTSVRQSDRGDKSCNLSSSPGIFQLVQSNVTERHGHVECSSTKPFVFGAASTASLPDLNSSATASVMFQQPFTDLQQMQLRAQIFVYGALIQGIAPDEPYMLAAFGGLDGGKSTWENSWRMCVERQHGHRAHPINPETPLQSHSGSKGSDQAIKQSTVPSKVISSSIGRASNKGTPTIVNPMIPLSSPLWNIPTPSSDVLQPSILPRGSAMDYQQGLSPFHPYQTPPIRNFMGLNAPWLSQATFRGPWVATPPSSASDFSARLSALPTTEPVHLTPVKEPSIAQSSVTKPSGSVVHSGVPTNIFPGTFALDDSKKTSTLSGKSSSDPKPRKRKKIPSSEDIGLMSVQSQPLLEQISFPAVTCNPSTSIAITTSSALVSKATSEKSVLHESPVLLSDHLRKEDQVGECRTLLSEKTVGKVKEARQQAEDAAVFASEALKHSQEIWCQLDRQKSSGLDSDVEAKIASAAVAVAAAAAVAKAAAAAAKVASNAALQAKLLADETLASIGYENSGQGNESSAFGSVGSLEKTPVSILRGEDGANSSNSIIFAAKEAARKRVEAASAASKHAENMDAIVKAAELAAEAVSQAGKIVAMGEPLSLSKLAEAGPNGYWKLPYISTEPGMKSYDARGDCENSSDKHSKDRPRGKNEIQATASEKSPSRGEMSKNSNDDKLRLVDCIPGSTIVSGKNLREMKGRKVSDLAKTIGVVSESELGAKSSQNECEKPTDLKQNSIKEGSLVEVLKDGNGLKAAWFTANVLSLKDGKAYVCYTELQQEGLGQLMEWVTLEGQGDQAPKIRISHPISSIQHEGTRKRRRAALGDYAWSVGDRVDAWMQDSWWEGVVGEKNRKDGSTLTVHFPAREETSVVKSWHLRPSLIWKDGEWVEWSSSHGNDYSHEGDMPQEKRLKLGTPSGEAKAKDKVSKVTEAVEPDRAEDSRLLGLSANERVFNVGKNTHIENKSYPPRTVRTGLQEGSRVIFGVPKPGKKRKFMEVSKHYVADQSKKSKEATDSVNLVKYLMPQGSGSRGLKNTSKVDPKEKRVTESMPKGIKSGKPPGVSGRTFLQKDKFSSRAVSALGGDSFAVNKDSGSHAESTLGKHNLREIGSSFSTSEAAEGSFSCSSLTPSLQAPKRTSSLNSKPERANKGKLELSVRNLAKIDEEKVFSGNSGKSISDGLEPRRSNRRIQPTSRLLEGLQSSLIISKNPSASHDKRHKRLYKNAPKGNNI